MMTSDNNAADVGECDDLTNWIITVTFKKQKIEISKPQTVG